MAVMEASEAAIGSMNIAELMQIPAENHDMLWLENALHAAVKLELATIPPYLFAYWSIKDADSFMAQGVREIAMQEMLHMATVCNLLSAIGKAPKINTLAQVPVYPGPLPDGIRPGLIVSLAAFSTQQIQVFMSIEYPEHGPIALLACVYSTIGAFYTAIETAFNTLRPPLSLDRQFAGPLGLQKIGDLTAVRNAIELIKIQGEGSTVSPNESPGELAHYYRFGEMYHRKRLIYVSRDQKWEYAGDNIPMPAVWPVDTIPAGGYRKQDVPANVWTQIAACDTLYTKMLNQIAGAWQTGDRRQLVDALGSMTSMVGPATQLMQTRKPSGTGTYGPCFRFTPG